VADDELDDVLPPPVNFKLTLAEKVRALEGLPSHLRRKRDIEAGTELLLRELRRLREMARAEEPDAAAAETLFRARAALVDLGPINALIDGYNKWYPIEANLPIDLKSGLPSEGGRPFAPRPPITLPVLLALLD
jgi:hypothetical protein